MTTQTEREAQEPATNGYVQPVPDKCDRITWRNQYFHLPLYASPVTQRPLLTAREVELLEALKDVPATAEYIERLRASLKQFADALPMDKDTVKTCYAITNEMRDAAHDALGKTK